jgi:hypothetical protein
VYNKIAAIGASNDHIHGSLHNGAGSICARNASEINEDSSCTLKAAKWIAPRRRASALLCSKTETISGPNVERWLSGYRRRSSLNILVSIASGLFHGHSQPCKARQMLHSCHFHLQKLSSLSRKAIRMAIAGRVLFRESLNPTVTQQAPKGAIEGACALDHTAATHLLNVLQNRIPVPRLFSQAQKNEQHRFAQRFRVPGKLVMSYDVMSHNAIMLPSSHWSQEKNDLRLQIWLLKVQFPETPKRATFTARKGHTLASTAAKLNLRNPAKGERSI